jgi:hypothetical protein
MIKMENQQVTTTCKSVVFILLTLFLNNLFIQSCSNKEEHFIEIKNPIRFSDENEPDTVYLEFKSDKINVKYFWVGLIPNMNNCGFFLNKERVDSLEFYSPESFRVFYSPMDRNGIYKVVISCYNNGSSPNYYYFVYELDEKKIINENRFVTCVLFKPLE